MMFHEPKLHDSPVNVAIDRDHLQPHFDFRRFGKSVSQSQRLEDVKQGTNRTEAFQQATTLEAIDSLLAMMSDMLLSSDRELCLRAAGDTMRKQLNACYVVIASSMDGMSIDDVMPIGLPAVAEWIELRVAMRAAMLEVVLTCRDHHGQTVMDGSPSRLVEPRSTTGCGYAIQHFADQLHGCASFAAVPLLTSAGKCVGAMFVAWAQLPSGAEHVRIDHLERWTGVLADVMQSKIGPKRGLTATIAASLRKRLPVRKSLVLTLSGLALLALGMIPTPCPVRAKVTVEPDGQRWISAPFDSPLKKSHVMPGEQVSVGQLLYSLDCQDMLNKLATLRAESDKYASERATHLSSARLGDAAIASSNLKRIQSEIELIYTYLDRAEICSPVDGVVLGQDLSRLEGSPIKQGQALIEIAPLDSLHLKAEIPTDRISYAVIGNDATITIDSIGRLGTAKLTRIHPRAEANDQGNYMFEGRIDLTEPHEGLMPGMSGYATLHGQPQPWAWSVFQQLWQRLQAWSQPA